MPNLDKYIEYKENNTEFDCVFNINRLGSIMFLDGNLKIILDDKMDRREAEAYIDQNITVYVNTIDVETNTVYVSRIKSLNKKICEAIEKGEIYRCVGTVIRVNKYYAYVDIENSGIIGVISVDSWRKNAYIRNLTEKCSVGDVIEVCVVGKVTKEYEMNAEWKLSREDITLDPWSSLLDDVWVKDTTINVECVEIPKEKMFWWGKCSAIEDIELICDFSSRIEVRVNGKYRCKIREVNKDKRLFMVAAPFLEIESANDTEDVTELEFYNDLKELSKEAKQAETNIKVDNADNIALNIISIVNEYEDFKMPIINILTENSLANEQVVVCLNKAIIGLIGSNNLEKAYELLKVFRGNFSFNPKMYLGLVSQVVGQFKKKGNKEYVEALYGELLLFIKMNIDSVDTKVFVGTMNAAINYYSEEKRYTDIIKLLSIYASKMPANDALYNYENSRLYFYRGMLQESKGNYSSAKSEFYFCLKYANKKKNKDGYNKYIGMAVAEMRKCDGLIEEMKNRPKTDEDIIDEFYQRLAYEEAYNYALKLYTDNQDNQDIAKIYDKAKSIYEKSQIRMASLPLENKKGKFYRYAFAAESIEENFERAENLWKKSIEEKEPGRLYAITAYINVLCKQGKYYDALEAHEKYQSFFTDVIEIYAFRIRVVAIYKKLGAFEEAVEEGLKIANKYSKNQKFIDAGGRKRLASLYQSIAAIQTKELGLYIKAMEILDKAKDCGIDPRIYASAYINNCIMVGKNDRAITVMEEYADELSDEYIASVKKNLSASNNSVSDSNISLWDQNFVQNDETFFDWYIETQISECTEDVKTYFDMEDFKSVDDIKEYISKYDNYETNLKAQMYLNIISAKYIIDTMDGYASSDYYSFVASALHNDIEIRNRTNRRNIVLLKYELIALYESRNENLLRLSLENVLKELSMVRDSNVLLKNISVLFNNNPILKSLDNWATDTAIQLIQLLTSSSSLADAKKKIEDTLSEYTDRQNQIIENKNLLQNYLDVDLKSVDSVLVELLGDGYALLQDDRTFINKIIEINRSLMGVSKQKDYLSIDVILDKTTEMISNTRTIMEDSITPLCLSMWFEILDSYESIILDERNKIEVTLSSRLSLSIDNTSLFESHGRVTVAYLIKNAENCAPAKDIHISFEDSEGNLLISKDVLVDKLLGGESKSLAQEFNSDKTFSLTVIVKYKDNVGVIKKIELSENILVNQETSFNEIYNPFTTEKFDPQKKPNMIFVGRDELINNLETRLLDGSIRCAVLYGQKRTGKSSIFNKLSYDLADSFVTAKIVMNSVYSMDTFYRAVAKAFEREEKDNADIIRQIKEIPMPRDSFEFEDYLDAIKNIYEGKKILLLLDEFSHLYDLRRTEFPEQFMNSWKEMMEYNLFSAIITGQETLNDLIRIYPNQFAVQYTVPVEYIPFKYFRDMIDKPLYDSRGCSRFEENSFEIFWQLTKGQPYISHILAGKLVEYLNSCKMEKIYDATINKVVEEYIRTATEKDFDSFYCKYSSNSGEYTDEVNATLRLLIKIAEECSYNGNYSCDISRIPMNREEEAIKADLVRRGIIIIDGNRCEIYVKLFYEWLNNKCKNTFSMQESYSDAVEKEQFQQEKNKEITPVINNYFNGSINQISGDVNQVKGNIVHSQVNNVTISIENAVMGLEKLQHLIDNPSGGIVADDVQKQIEGVKFDSKVWDTLSEDEQEEKSTEYAERIFTSEAFINKELTEDQKIRFHLSEETLQLLSSDCKKQIICGIQVYDLIQYCIDNFGLEMEGLESPRAILFARAFEKHMKDCMYKAFGKIDVFSSQMLKWGNRNVSIAEYPINRTTIGNYTTMLKYKNSYKVLQKYAVERLGYVERDDTWWNVLNKQLVDIGKLRNDCCHSGSSFDSGQLNQLIYLIFEKKAIDSVYVIHEIYEIILSDNAQRLKKENDSIITQKEKQNMKGTELSKLTVSNLDLKIGTKCVFTMKEKTGRKSIRGIVNNKYPASMSPNEAKKTSYESEKQIQVYVDSFQNGKYVVKIQ